MTTRLDLPFHAAIAHLEPGELDPRVYDQDEFWVDQWAQSHRLCSMATAHLLNVQLHIATHAVGQWIQHLSARDNPAWLAVLTTPHDSLIQTLARAWAEKTTLWRGIDVELDRRAALTPVEEKQ